MRLVFHDLGADYRDVFSLRKFVDRCTSRCIWGKFKNKINNFSLKERTSLCTLSDSTNHTK